MHLDQQLDRIVQKVLTIEAPGMRTATLVGASHIPDGDTITSLVVFDKAPHHTDVGMLHERRWTVVVSIKNSDELLSRTGGVVSSRWEKVDG